MSATNITALIDALKAHTQADEDGVMCIVSREACHVAAELLAVQDSGLERALGEVDRLRDVIKKIADYGERHQGYVNAVIDGKAMSRFARDAIV